MLCCRIKRPCEALPWLNGSIPCMRTDPADAALSKPAHHVGQAPTRYCGLVQEPQGVTWWRWWLHLQLLHLSAHYCPLLALPLQHRQPQPEEEAAAAVGTEVIDAGTGVGMSVVTTTGVTSGAPAGGAPATTDTGAGATASQEIRNETATVRACGCECGFGAGTNTSDGGVSHGRTC